MPFSILGTLGIGGSTKNAGQPLTSETAVSGQAYGINFLKMTKN